MGRKYGKKRVQKPKPKQAPTRPTEEEDLPPPVLRREVDLTPAPSPAPAEGSEAESDSGGRVSPAVSNCSSTISLLSIGPPPYVYTKTPKKKIGAPMSSVAEYVQSVNCSDAPSPEPYYGTPEKRGMSGTSSSVPKFVAKEKPRATPKKAGNSKSGPVASTSKARQTPLIDLTEEDIPAPARRYGRAQAPRASTSRRAPLIDLTEEEDIPVAGPSRGYRIVNLPTQTPVAGTSRQSLVAKSSSNTSKKDVDVSSDEESMGGHVSDTSNESQSPVSFRAASPTDFPMGSPSAADMSRDFATHCRLFRNSQENPTHSGLPEFGSPYAMPAELTLDSMSGRTSFADPEDIPDDLAGENFDDMTDEILSTIADRERSFELLLQYDLLDFPVISACIQNEEGKMAVGTASENYQTQNKTTASVDQKMGDIIALEDLDSLQVELETLRYSMITRANILHREQRLLRKTANSTRDFVEKNFDPKLFESCSIKDSSDSADDDGDSVIFEKIESGTKISEEVLPGPSSPIAGTSESFMAPPKGKNQQTKGKGAGNRKKSAGKLDETNQPDPFEDADEEEYEPFNLYAIPDSFWEFVDAYCRKITRLDVDNLERFLAEHLGYPEMPEELLYIPPLGKHYTLVNDANEKTDSQEGSPKPGTSKGKASPATKTGSQEGSPKPGTSKGKASPATKTGSQEGSPKPGTSKGKATPATKSTSSQPGAQKSGSFKDKVGPLTQRLVRTLVDERVNHFRNTRARARAAAQGIESQVEETNHVPLLQRPGLVKALGLDGNGSPGKQIPLEQKIRNCLSDHKDLFGEEADEQKVDDPPPTHDPEDEVLAEILRTQAELKRLHEYNKRGFAALKAKAMMEILRNELNGEVDTVDGRILSMIKVEKLTPNYTVPARHRNGVRHALDDRTNAIRTLNTKPTEEESEQKADTPTAGEKPPAGKKKPSDPKADKGGV